MSDIIFNPHSGEYYSSGFIDIDSDGNVVFPDIPGTSTIDTYTNYANVSDYVNNAPLGTQAALDHFVIKDVPAFVVPGCEAGGLITTGYGWQLNAAFAASGGSLLAERVTCTGHNHVLGVPTLFDFDFYVLSDLLSPYEILGLITVLVVITIVFCQSCTQRLILFTKQLASIPPPGFTAALSGVFIFAAAGVALLLGAYVVEKHIAAPGQTPVLPYLGPITAPSTPIVSSGETIRAGPITTFSGVGPPPRAAAPSRRARGR